MKLLVNDKELAYYLISLIDLKELCKEYGLSGYSTKRKNELIEMLEKYEAKKEEE